MTDQWIMPAGRTVDESPAMAEKVLRIAMGDPGIEVRHFECDAGVAWLREASRQPGCDFLSDAADAMADDPAVVAISVGVAL